MNWDLSGRRIFLAWPEEPPPPGGYRLLLLLDGNAVFGTAVEALRMQSRKPLATGVAPALIAAIGHPGDAPHDLHARRRDYTPPGAGDGSGSGGADAFLDFIQADVLPGIAEKFPCDAARLGIFGHSFGGLLVLHALFTRPGLFRHHVAASPSIWWADRAVLRSAEAFVAQPPPGAARLRLLMTMGELENGDPGQEASRQARLAERRMGGNARDLATLLRPCLPEVHYVEFAGENHASVLPAAISRALRFVLDPAA